MSGSHLKSPESYVEHLKMFVKAQKLQNWRVTQQKPGFGAILQFLNF
jgi:hypothetical protein